MSGLEELDENRASIREIVHALLRPVLGVKWSHRTTDDMEEMSIPKAPPTAKVSLAKIYVYVIHCWFLTGT